MSASLPVVDPETLEDSYARAQRLWCTVVHDDPVNTMNYVTWVFKTYFGYTHERAERLMKEVHFKGRAVVSAGSREEMEADVLAMCGYGLWATLEQEAD